jgi:PASTA domain
VVLTFAALAIAGCGGGGEDDWEVPDVVGKPTGEALAAIEDAGLRPVVQELGGDEPVGRVYYMEEPAGSKLPEGTTIDIWVIGGPAEPAPEPAESAPKPAAPTPSPPPHLRRQRYDRALTSLDRKCNQDSSLIARYIEKAQELIQRSGQYESLTSVAEHVNGAYPAGMPVTNCSDIFAAYVTLRQGGG